MGISVSERVGEVEGRLETYQQQIEGRMEGLQVGLNSMRNEFRQHPTLLPHIGHQPSVSGATLLLNG